jgi:hypothetical protein
VDLPLRNLARTAALAVGLALGAQSAALAQKWIGPVVAAYDDVDHDCRLEVSGNGRFYRLTATGLEPGEAAWLTLLNGDLKPIERTVKADAAGTWADYYLPGVGGRRGGVVQAALSGARCDLGLAFDWHRPSSYVGPVPDWPVSHFPEN